MTAFIGTLILIGLILILAWAFDQHRIYCNRLWDECLEARGGPCQTHRYTKDQCGHRVEWPPCEEHYRSCGGV